MGGTAYLIQESTGNILVDCPAWDEGNQAFLSEQGGVRWLFLTHRGSIGKVAAIQSAFDCQVVIQEQEAYLLPEIQVTSFQHEMNLSPHSQTIWTPGHSPASSCLYHAAEGGILFSGRHLLPNQQGDPVPLRLSKTFHWRRQLNSVQRLLERFSPESLEHICPGANTGFLRGARSIDRAYERLATLNLQALQQSQVVV